MEGVKQTMHNLQHNTPNYKTYKADVASVSAMEEKKLRGRCQMQGAVVGLWDGQAICWGGFILYKCIFSPFFHVPPL